MNLIKSTIENDLIKITVNLIKSYRSKGPEYVKVKIEENIIEIKAKGLLTNLAKILIANGEIDLVKFQIERVSYIFYKILIKDIEDKTKIKCRVINEESDFEHDERVVYLEVIEGYQKG